MPLPPYAAARIAALKLQPHLAAAGSAVSAAGAAPAALPQPSIPEIETIIDAAFWASLRREEGHSPKISLAWLPPDRAGGSLAFLKPMPLDAEALVHLAPAVERPGIHLGVWRDGEALTVWGATRSVPPFSFVLEVVAPGLLVVKRRREDEAAKFVNVVVLEGDQVKVLDSSAVTMPDCPDLLAALVGFEAAARSGDSVSALVELAVSMRAHGRGGALLMTPSDSDEWRESIVQPVSYAIDPPFTRLADLMAEPKSARSEPRWHEAFRRSIDGIAGLTSVDGATVINRRCDVLAFGAKIHRRPGWPQVEQVLQTEPIEGSEAHTVPPVQTGGTRHLSAAQFVHDQRDSAALVASQDGRFTIFEWSPCHQTVHAHRVESLLL
jgi:hypothetical protein